MTVYSTHPHLHTFIEYYSWKHFKSISPNIFQTVAQRSLRGFWKPLKGVSGCCNTGLVYSSLGEVGHFDMAILIRDSSWLNPFDADLVSWHGCAKWSCKVITSLFLIISNACNSYSWSLLYPNPYSCSGDFHFLFYSFINCLNSYAAYLLLIFRKNIKDIS